MNLHSTSQTSQRESFLDFLPIFFMTVTFTSETCKNSERSLFPAYLGSKKKRRVLAVA